MEADNLHRLLGQIALRNHQALRSLFELLSPRLLAIAMRILRDRSLAEDVLQEVFINLWEKIDQMPALHTHPLAWLTSMVRNKCIDATRKVRPEVPLEWTDGDGQTHSHDVVDENSRPEAQLQSSQGDAKVDECMQKLGDEPRQAVRLAYLEGLTHMELADRLNKPLGTIKAWIRRSLLQLKDCLGEEHALAGL